MPKAKAGVKKAKPAAKKPTAPKLGLLKATSKKVAKAAANVVKAATKLIKSGDAPAKGGKPVKAASSKTAPPKAITSPKAVVAAKVSTRASLPEPAEAPPPPAEAAAKAPKAKSKDKGKGSEEAGPVPEKALPRASKLPPPGILLTKREMEQLLTAGQGRGVEGEGSLKGRLAVKDEFPYLQVIGRDKRELVFLLQGPDQEVLPAYADHKVSVSGFIRKTTNYGGTVDVRKYSAKKPEAEVVVPVAAVEEKLKYLSPGEVEQLCAAGMGAGIRGFASMRGNLEMTGDEFFLVTSNGGTRQQVSFLLEGKGAKGLRKHVGHLVQVNGVAEKMAGWGGKIQLENFEPRLSENKATSRASIEVIHVDGGEENSLTEMKITQGLTVRLPERAGFTWAIEPTVAKRVGLREANFEPGSAGTATREFFFTPRTPGTFDIDFFLAKVFMPTQVTKTFKLNVIVKP